MVGTYQVMEGRQVAGEIQVEQQGLYYHFSCRCHPTGRGMLRLWMRRGRRETDLGRCEFQLAKQ